MKPHIRYWRGHLEIQFERDGWPYLAVFYGTVRGLRDWWWRISDPTPIERL